MSQREKWTESFQQASERISEWRGKHARASFSEIENTVDGELAKVRAAMIQDLALASAMTDIKSAPSPTSASWKPKPPPMSNWRQLTIVAATCKSGRR